MKKHFEQEEPQTLPANEPDVLGMLKKIQQHLVFLERKIDALVERSSGGPFDKGRNFQQHRKPSGNSFRPDRGNFRHHPSGGNFRQDRRPHEGRPFERPQGNEGRSFDRPAESEGERSFRSKGRFSRHRGPKRHF